ncbi:hypothetical protein BH09SUM1_BH09SUM1_17660 [soil metagenome]
MPTKPQKNKVLESPYQSQELRLQLEAIRRSAKSASKSKKTAVAFLQGAGILDEKGELAEPYR